MLIVKPLFKKGEKNGFINYRPISLLPTISKFFERAIYFQLYNYFNKNNLLAEQQYGFRPQHSTELAKIKLIDSIIYHMDDKKNIKTPYSLRMHPLPLPVIAHTFAESSLVFQLVNMKNNISVNDTLILKKIEERSHSHSGFST